MQTATRSRRHKGGTRVRFTGRVTRSLGNSSTRFHGSTFESATFFASASGSARNLSAHTGASAATTARSERSFAILSAVLPSDQPPKPSFQQFAMVNSFAMSVLAAPALRLKMDAEETSVVQLNRYAEQ